jgi:dienelactone hydrolase
MQSASRMPIGDEAFRAVLSFFDYDRTVPLEARILARSEEPEYVREKIVFTGGRGDRVPAYLAVPKTETPPYPVVLQLHAGASSKEAWWESDSFERGQHLTRALLASGIAVVCLDAQFHGERSANNDYLSLREMYFEKQWHVRYRDLLVESSRDWLRSLDYLATRPEIDLRGVAAIGHSMGGLIAIYLTALDPRIRTLVACVGALSEKWLLPLDPINFAARIRDKNVLMMAGRSDPLISIEATEQVFGAIACNNKQLVTYDSEHRLPDAYIDRAASWLQTGLS